MRWDHVRDTFCDRYALEGYAPLDGLPRQLFSGGLAQTAALLNSMIAGAITAIGLLFVTSPRLLALSAAIVSVLSLAAQFAYIRRSHERR